MRSIIDTTKNWKRPMKTIKNADRVSNLGPSCGRLEPSCPSLGRSWGLVGQSWPQVEPMLRPCRIETENLDDVVPICMHTCANYYYSREPFFGDGSILKMTSVEQNLFVSLAAKSPCGCYCISWLHRVFSTASLN